MAWPAWPAAVLAVVIVLSLLNGTRSSVLGQAGIAPLVAASVVNVKKTAWYGAAALAVVALLGIRNHSYDSATLTAQIERLALVALSGAIGIAIARARINRENRLRSMTSIADIVQQALLPQPPAELGRLRVATGYLAAAADAHIGGDFYDVRQTPFGVRLLIGDVRGKGLDAVRMAGVVMAAFRQQASERVDLTELLADLDLAVQRESVDDNEEFVTAVIAELDDDLVYLRLALAGHPPPVLVRRGVARLIDHNDVGLPLGIDLDGMATKVLIEPLEAGDRLVFYTDGTTEARSTTGAFFPLVERASTLAASDTIAGVVDATLRAVQTWAGEALHDDAALLAIEIGPPQADPTRPYLRRALGSESPR